MRCALRTGVQTCARPCSGLWAFMGFPVVDDRTHADLENILYRRVSTDPWGCGWQCWRQRHIGSSTVQQEDIDIGPRVELPERGHHHLAQTRLNRSPDGPIARSTPDNLGLDRENAGPRPRPLTPVIEEDGCQGRLARSPGNPIRDVDLHEGRVHDDEIDGRAEIRVETNARHDPRKKLAGNSGQCFREAAAVPRQTRQSLSSDPDQAIRTAYARERGGHDV